MDAVAPATLRSGGVIAGYRLLRPLGQGAHGRVDLAEHLESAALVALKRVSLPTPQAALGFGTAAHAAQRLSHPGIVAVHAAGVEGTTGWLAMEPVPGSDLARYTTTARLLPGAVVLGVGARIAEALAHAHGQGVVHRDLKPANVLVDWASDTVKLADFGLARAADSAGTATGVVLGSPAYMAPEQIAGAVPTPASDFHALGAMLFELLTGRLPYASSNMGELLRSIASEPPPQLAALRPDLPTGVGTLVARLLAKQPAARPARGAELAAALRALAATVAPGA